MHVRIHIFATKDVEKDESLWISDIETTKRTYHPAVIFLLPQSQK